MQVEIIRAEKHHIEQMEGLLELRRICRMMLNPKELLAMNLDLSHEAYTGLVNGKPVCVFGVYIPCYLGSHITPWMMATDGIKEARVTFLRQSRRFIGDLQQRYGMFQMKGVVDAEFADSVKWLKWLGFHLTDAGKCANVTIREFVR